MPHFHPVHAREPDSGNILPREPIKMAVEWHKDNSRHFIGSEMPGRKEKGGT